MGRLANYRRINAVFTERLSRAAKLRYIIKINTASRLSGALGESGYRNEAECRNCESERALQDFRGMEPCMGAVYLYGSHVTPRVSFLILVCEKRSVIRRRFRG